tara:strand:- start:137 stop:439 length:303 start_codon:yes stop_codon:yes gene_type:complete
MKRLTPDARKIDILEAAIIVAICGHYRHMTRAEVAAQAGVSAPLVTHYFSDMEALRVELMVYAVENGEAEIVAQGLLDKNEHAAKASDELKAKAKETLGW